MRVSQIGSHEEHAALPRANRESAECRKGDQPVTEPATESAFPPVQVRPVDKTTSQVVSDAVRTNSLARSTAGTRLINSQDAVGQFVEPGVSRAEDSHRQRIAEPQSASPTSRMLSVILRADMTEEELDEAAKRLRPSSGEEIATSLARKYKGTISGMHTVLYLTKVSLLRGGFHTRQIVILPIYQQLNEERNRTRLLCLQSLHD